MDSVMTVTSLFILAVSGYFAVRLHGMRAVRPLRRLRAALTSRRAGSIGGQLVKKMIESYENNLK